MFRRTIERVASLDPAEASSVYAARATALVYETLLEYDYQARPYRLIPGLADALPRREAEGRRLRFRIRPEARFAPDPCFGRDAQGRPQGRPVTAADVVFSLKRLADAKLASPGYWLLDGRIRGLEAFRRQSATAAPTDYDLPVAGLQASDRQTLVIELTAPCPQFAWMLAMPYTAVVPREAAEFYGPRFGEHPVGSGPYWLDHWRRNYAMAFRRNPDWHGWRHEPPSDHGVTHPFERLVFPVMDDPSTRWLAFLAGELDFQGEIGRDIWDSVVTPAGTLQPDLAARGIRMHSMPTLEVAYIGINMDDPLLGTNRLLRQALNCAFDSRRWNAYYQGRVQTADGPLPPGVAGRLNTPFEFAFDLDKARRLLAAAGYPEGRDPVTGRRLRLTLDLGRTTQETRESTELLAAFMARIGIDLQASYHHWPAFLRKVAQRQSQLFRIAWVGDYPDAENFLQLFYGPNASPGPNRCNFNHEPYNERFRRAMATSDLAARHELYADLQRIVRRECPWVFIHFPRNYSLVHRHVEGFQPHDFPYGMEKHLRSRRTPRGSAPRSPP